MTAQELLAMAVQVTTCVNLTVNALVAVVLLRRGRKKGGNVPLDRSDE